MLTEENASLVEILRRTESIGKRSPDYHLVLDAMRRVDRKEFISGSIDTDDLDEIRLVALSLHYDAIEIFRQYRFGSRERAFAMAKAMLPKHTSCKEFAYLDMILPTAAGINASQPLVIATMLDLLDLHPAHKVLELGTGTGYPTSIMYELIRSSSDSQIYSAEINPEVAEFGRANIE